MPGNEDLFGLAYLEHHYPVEVHSSRTFLQVASWWQFVVTKTFFVLFYDLEILLTVFHFLEIFFHQLFSQVVKRHKYFSVNIRYVRCQFWIFPPLDNCFSTKFFSKVWHTAMFARRSSNQLEQYCDKRKAVIFSERKKFQHSSIGFTAGEVRWLLSQNWTGGHFRH